jgi:hypothetical protein
MYEPGPIRKVAALIPDVRLRSCIRTLDGFRIALDAMSRKSAPSPDQVNGFRPREVDRFGRLQVAINLADSFGTPLGRFFSGAPFRRRRGAAILLRASSAIAGRVCRLTLSLPPAVPARRAPDAQYFHYLQATILVTKGELVAHRS